MKTVNDIIWSDLFNDDTNITIYDIRGDRLSLTGLRFEDEILDWGHFEVYTVNYFPNTNSLYIMLTFNSYVKLQEH